jgi:hypothetical protein
MRVFWTSAAEQDRANILEYISRDNPLAAIRLDEAFAASRPSSPTIHSWEYRVEFPAPVN